jgi:hypothetical protein
MDWGIRERLKWVKEQRSGVAWCDGKRGMMSKCAGVVCASTATLSALHFALCAASGTQPRYRGSEGVRGRGVIEADEN